MSMPEGLREPRRILFLIPIVALLVLVGVTAVSYIDQLIVYAAHPPVAETARAGAQGAHHASWEILLGAGIVLLFLAIAYGAWRYHTRPKSTDRVTAARTRELYDGETPPRESARGV